MMELPIPEVGPNDVVIRVRAAGVNPADISFREGRYAQMMPLTFPAIMGSDFGGTVAQVGAQVTAVRPETQVYGISFGGGSYAEYIRVAAEGEFTALPASLDVVHAAALPMAGMTALGALDTAALAPGDVLLIVGGAGGIGTFAIQMAAQLGAHVIATARSEDLEYIRSLGAAETIDFTRGDVVEAVRTSHPGGVDAVLDVMSGAAAIGHVAQALRPGGRLLSTVYAVDPAQFAERGITAVNVVRPSGATVLRRLSRMIESGALRVPVHATLSLEAAARAQEMLQHLHVRGKLVLMVA
jgi:NADPH:quinone reductase-like Zn-dependent oxidoreductase